MRAQNGCSLAGKPVAAVRGKGVFVIPKRPQMSAEQNLEATWMTISDFIAFVASIYYMSIFTS